MLTNSVINATVLANVMGQQIVQMALMRKTVLQVFFLDTLTLIHNQTHCLGLKRATTTHPLHNTVWEAGDGIIFSTALKICIIKTFITYNLSSKAA
jgi:hypothetical protein